MGQQSGGILIVDNSRTTVNILTDILQREGYEVLSAGCGKDALDIVENKVPDCILMEVDLPTNDGFETCKRIRSLANADLAQVILMSATRASVEDKVEGFSSGAIDFIVKPFPKEEVLVRVKTHMQISCLTNDLKSYAERLEEKVEERTKTLAEKNAELELKEIENQEYIKAIKFLERKYRALYHNPVVAMTISDQHLNVIEANNAWYNLMGYSPEDVKQGLNVADFSVEDETLVVDRMQQKLMDHEQSFYELKKTHITKQGKKLSNKVYVHAIYGDDETYLGCCAIVQNMDGQ